MIVWFSENVQKMFRKNFALTHIKTKFSSRSMYSKQQEKSRTLEWAALGLSHNNKNNNFLKKPEGEKMRTW